MEVLHGKPNLTRPLLLSIIVCVAGWIILWVAGNSRLEALRKRMEPEARKLEEDLYKKMASWKRGGPYLICRGELDDFHVILFDSAGLTLCGPNAEAPPYSRPYLLPFQSDGLPEVAQALKGQTAHGLGFDPGGNKEYALARPVMKEGRVKGAIRISKTLSYDSAYKKITLFKIAWVGLSFVIFSVIMSALVTGTLRLIRSP